MPTVIVRSCSALEKRALRLQRNTVDFIQQDDFGRRHRPELGDQLAGRRVDHLEADHFGRLQVGAPLEAREFGVADGGEDDAEERLADARHAAQQQVAGVHLTLFALVVGGRNFRHQDDVGEGLGGVVADECFATFFDDGLVKVDRFLEVRMHGGLILSQGDGAKAKRHSLPHPCVSVLPRRPDPDIVPRHARTHDGLPLTIPAIVRRAQTLFGHRPVSGRRPDRSITRTSYAVVLDRAEDGCRRPSRRSASDAATASRRWRGQARSTSRRIWRFRRSVRCCTR